MNLLLKATISISIITAAQDYFPRLLTIGNFSSGVISNNNDTIIKRFNRHGLLYIDKKLKRKIISRYVYLDGKILYKYPVTKENIGHGVIVLLSGNNFLKQGVDDTIQFSNYALPPMNRAVYLKGGLISRLSDTSYKIRSNSKSGTIATFVISASDNYEEIKNRQSFIVDSLILPIR